MDINFKMITQFIIEFHAYCTQPNRMGANGVPRRSLIELWPNVFSFCSSVYIHCPVVWSHLTLSKILFMGCNELQVQRLTVVNHGSYRMFSRYQWYGSLAFANRWVRYTGNKVRVWTNRGRTSSGDWLASRCASIRSSRNDGIGAHSRNWICNGAFCNWPRREQRSIAWYGRRRRSSRSSCSSSGRLGMGWRICEEHCLSGD